MALTMFRSMCLLLALIGLSGRSVFAQTIEIESAAREISLTTQVTIVATKFSVKNVGKQAVDFMDVCHLFNHTAKAAVFEVVQGVDDDSQPLPLSASATGNQQGAACFRAQLLQPLQPGKTRKIRSGASFTHLQTPFPASIFQSEPQRVLYLDTVHIISPYKINKQSTKIKLPSKNVESYTKFGPVSFSQSTLKYGEFGPQEPFTITELRLHYENNSPFAVATKLVREVEISHWGNVYLEEHYTIKHLGAKIRGEWSRLDLSREPTTFGQTAVRGFLAHLPVGANSIYFKDAIGNISTSQVRPGMQAVEVILTPRYPLYGGWQAEFILGYSLPLQDVVRRSKSSGDLTAVALFGSSLAGVIVDDIENRVVLPEGSTLKGVNIPFLVEQSSDTKYTYLDTSGRPVVVVSKNNVVFEHNVGFTVDYSFSTISLLREPLLLIGVYFIFFALVIIYCRCNFVLTRGTAWEAEDKAERTAFLVGEITSLIAEREKEVSNASGGGASDITGLLERLKRSEVKLQSRCKDLESIAGPKHSAVVRDLLEKEKAVQSRIFQIANSRSQASQKGSSNSGTLQQGLQDVLAGLKQEHAKKLDQLT